MHARRRMPAYLHSNKRQSQTHRGLPGPGHLCTPIGPVWLMLTAISCWSDKTILMAAVRAIGGVRLCNSPAHVAVVTLS
jgi:hypothetical protein